jgi:hypothetical protein
MTSLVTDADGVRGSEDVRLAGDDEALDDDVDEVDGDRVDDGPVHLAYNPSYSACFFSRNSIFLSQKISQQCFSAGL